MRGPFKPILCYERAFKLPGASQVDPFLPPWCLASCPTNPFLPPWCLPGCPIDPFLPPWCLSRSTGLPSESRFRKGAGFCLTFNTISMANGPARSKSLGGLHGRLPVAQTLPIKVPLSAQECL